MTGKPTKVERLVRWRRFRQELAEGNLRQALSEHGKAVTAQDAAQASLDALGEWKAHRNAEGGLDVGLYAAVLAMEQRAMQQVETLRTETESKHVLAEDSRRRLADSSASTRVAERRDARERVVRNDRDEKRQFDQLSEQRLVQRETKR